MKHKKEGKKTIPTSNLKPSNPKYYYDHEPLRDALFFIQDMLERSSLPFILLGNTAKQIIEQEDPLLYDYKLTLGIRRRDYHPSGASMLKGLLPQIDIYEDRMFYIHDNGVPIYIKILEDETWFNNPDVRFYYQTEFKLPNPFIDYWEKRGQND